MREVFRRGAIATVFVTLGVGSGWLSGSATAEGPASIEAVVRKVENPSGDDGLRPGVIEFQSGKRFQTSVYEVEVIGILKAARKAPFLVLSARSCTNCDADVSIYIHSPDDGPMPDAPHAQRFSYPGKLYHFLEGDLIEEWRVFIGRCTRPTEDGIVWFGRERMRNGKWTETVFVARVAGDQLRLERSPKPRPSLDMTLKRVATGTCSEIPGMERTSEP